nr:MAG TPA: hypothetical protein [Microviridae sp.]
MLSPLSFQPAGGPLWGEQGSLNLYDETGVEHEKNVGRPRAAAVASGGAQSVDPCFFFKYSREYSSFF